MHATTHLETDNVKAKKCWIGQSAAKRLTMIDNHGMMKVQRLAERRRAKRPEMRDQIMPKHVPVEERFYQRISKRPDGCWEWTGFVMKSGYGQMRYQDKTAYVHRVAYELAFGPVGEAYVLHKCDNRKCVNPEHLFLGDHDDNMRDMFSKGRQARGTRNSHAKLTEEQVLAIRKAHGTHKEIGTLFNVSQPLVSMIRTRRIWRHI